MKERTHSASSLKTLELCEYKYLRTYEEKHSKIEDQENALPFGTTVHLALEKLYALHRTRQSSEYRFSKKDYDYIYEQFINKAAETKLMDVKLLDEGWSIIRGKMDSFDYSEKVLVTEFKFDLKTPAGTSFLGYIDKIIEIDENTVAVVDYKTSMMAETQEEADSDIQLSMYDLAVSMVMPKYKTIVLVLDYLRLQPVMSYRTKEQRRLFSDFLDSTNKYIKDKDKSKVVPSLNSLCGWCPFKSECPEFIKAITESPASIPAIDKLPTDELISKWKQYRGISKAVESATSVLKMKIEEMMKESDDGIIGTSERLVSSQNTRLQYDIAGLRDIIPDSDLLKMCSISKNAVDKYVANHGDLSFKIRAAASVAYNSPYFKVVRK